MADDSAFADFVAPMVARETPSEALMTLTTCHPKFTVQDRLVVRALYGQPAA